MRASRRGAGRRHVQGRKSEPFAWLPLLLLATIIIQLGLQLFTSLVESYGWHPAAWLRVASEAAARRSLWADGSRSEFA